MTKRVVVLPVLALLGACSAPEGAGVTWAVKYDTAPGQETHWCEYKKLPSSDSGELLVGGASWSWKNAHHWALYRLLPGAPVAELPLDQPFDCFSPVGAMKWAQPSSVLLQ